MSRLGYRECWAYQSAPRARRSPAADPPRSLILELNRMSGFVAERHQPVASSKSVTVTSRQPRLALDCELSVIDPKPARQQRQGAIKYMARCSATRTMKKLHVWLSASRVNHVQLETPDGHQRENVRSARDASPRSVQFSVDAIDSVKRVNPGTTPRTPASGLAGRHCEPTPGTRPTRGMLRPGTAPSGRGRPAGGRPSPARR